MSRAKAESQAQGRRLLGALRMQQGASGRKTAVYRAVHEDFEPASNAVMPSAAVLKQLLSWPLSLALIISLGGCASTPLKEKESKENLADIYINLGVGYMQEGNYQTALTKLQKALALDPNNPRAHDILGVVYSRLRDKTTAEQHFKEALVLAPDDPKTLNNYGQFLCQLGRGSEAEQMFAKAIHSPLYDAPEIAHTNAGLCAARNNDLAGAERHLREALEINPRLSVALLEMARVNYQLKKYLPARSYLERYAKVAQHTPQSLELGIQIERALGDQDAVAIYSQMLKSKFPDLDEAQ